MHFAVKKNIIQKKQSPFKGLINVLILMIAIPVVVIAGISLFVYFIFVWIKNQFSREKIFEFSGDHYHFEIDLIHNEHLNIILIEDEFDIELTNLNEAWQEKVYNEETCLYRAQTIPLIPALEGNVCCFYYKEQYGGVFLQVLPQERNSGNLNSQLVFLNYKDLGISVINETGPFFLYNDEKKYSFIYGFNKAEEMSIELIPSDDPVN